jgi:phosphate butyryltransferase
VSENSVLATFDVPAATALVTFDDIRRAARAVGPKRVAVVDADDEIALSAAASALLEDIAVPVLVGDEERIRARIEVLGLADLADRAEFAATGTPAETAVQLAREGAVDVLMKGHLRTDQLLRPVLDKQAGLRTGRLLCDVGIFEFHGEGFPRLVGLSDGGINVAPTLQQKQQILLGGIDVLRALGVQHPRVAVMSAIEVVTAAMPSTVEAEALSAWAAQNCPDADVYGPLALDNALFETAARAKGIAHPVAGHADFLLVPSIEAGNMLGKAILFLANWRFAHVVVGAQVPILIPSRVERIEDKLNSIALGVLYAAR